VLSACPGFLIPVYSPRDKRGIVWSGNRGLGIGIRVENGRPPMGGPRRKTGLARNAERESSAFHEERGAGKTDPPGGHDLVNGKKIVRQKEKLQKEDHA